MSYIEGYFGNLGKGKTSYGVHRLKQMKRWHPWAPVASTVPISLPGPGSLFLTRSPSDYIAFALVVSRFVWSSDARRMSNTLKSRAARRGGAAMGEAEILDHFGRLQEEYKRIASTIDPSDRSALDRWIAAHNWRVLNNKLDARLEDLEGEAFSMSQADFYALARHVHGGFRFAFNPPNMPFAMFLDEVGVSAGSHDNKELRDSAFYAFLAQLRKFGGRIAYATHEPMLVFKQMRDITDRFMLLRSWDLPRGRLYLVTGHNTAADLEARRKVRMVDVAWIPYGEMGRYPTTWIVQQPPKLASGE